jgi:adenine-specific DNA-methyltransferase
MGGQLPLAGTKTDEAPHEKEEFLSRQLITYIGNKRALLTFIGGGVKKVQERLRKNKLRMFDVFSGSGIVARYFKQFSDVLIVNDLEKYSALINECYLANEADLNIALLRDYHRDILDKAGRRLIRGLVSELYAPRDDNNIQAGERVFYTARNAMYIDTVRQLIAQLPQADQKYFLAPLLSEASIHANTSGVFKGFYKNRETGIGQFGGLNRDALIRITGDISLPFPIFSNFNCETIVYNDDSNHIIQHAPRVDLAYLDPPYNRHPYGSNYFMLNLILDYEYPASISRVSGIPEDWKRSNYNTGKHALPSLTELVENINATHVIVSFNSEGLISLREMKAMLAKIGKVEVLATSYNTFRGSRNLNKRGLHVIEYLYLLEK